MTTGSVTGASGVAGVDRSQMNLGDLIMLIQSERAELLESQLQDQVKQMQDINAKIKEANKWLAEARAGKEAAGKGNSDIPNDMIDYMEANGIKQGTSKWDREHKGEDHGLRLSADGYDYRQNAAEWDQTIANFKAHIDGLNSSSQMEMIRLQSLMNKRNQAFEMMTNALNKISGSMDKVIGNIR